MSLLAALLFIILIAFWAGKPFLFPRKRVYTRTKEINDLLNSNVPLADLLHARAVPNERLIEAFGLTSAFVSADPMVHKMFVAKAKSLINGHTWHSVALSAEAATHQFLPPRQLDFAVFIQTVSFAAVLSILFGTDLDVLRFDDVVYVTNIINHRWAASKVKGTLTLQDGSLDKISAYFHQWIPDREQYPNPLNFILPAFETMWRVVAVTVARVYRHRDNTLYNTIMAFGNNPTEEKFVDGRLSMQGIILEVLRLHPPTRHIARSPSGSWWQKILGPEVEIADVEGAHLSEAYGENFSEFDPTRFDPSTGKKPELHSFGLGKLRCIAASWAPMAAAIIAAKIVVQIEEGGYGVIVGRTIGRRSGWEGWEIRKNE